MKIAFCVFLALCAIITVSMVSSLQSKKSCAEFKIEPMKNFKKTPFQGLWFVHQLYDYIGSELNECHVQLRTLRRDGNYDTQELTVLSGSLLEIKVKASMIFDQPGNGHYKFVANGRPEYDGEFSILDTDYFNYYIVGACFDISNGSMVQLYIGSRTPIVTRKTQKDIDDFLIDHHFDGSALRNFTMLSCVSMLSVESVKTGGLIGVVGALLKLVLGTVGGVLGTVGGLLGGLLG